MFKLTFFLCAGLFAAMYFGGVDRGQQRFGLVEKPRVAAVTVVDTPEVAADVAEVTPAATPVTEAAFVPETPLMITPAVATAAPAVAVATAEPGVLMVVSSKSANVRSGPGKDYDVIDRLTRGELVLVVAQGEGPDGWSLIRIEGDGVEGYIASRLLRE